MYATLITTADLALRLTDPDGVIVDCRFWLAEPDRGSLEHQQAHIPGAVYAHLDRDLCGPIIPGQTGRHPLPDTDTFARRLSAWSIDSRAQVVAYDDAGGAMAAARLWWMLRWLGHDAVAVLDGGWSQWTREGRETRAGVESRPPRTFAPRPRPELLARTGHILASIGDGSLRLFDARALERYRGEVEPIDPVAGHIPGALCVPYAATLDADGKFLPPERLRAAFEALLGDAPAERAAFYCGSGVTAAQNILAVKHAGLGEARLYAGSWSEWIVDSSRPIKTGEE